VVATSARARAAAHRNNAILIQNHALSPECRT
jgi:hypothetical protein